MSKLDFMKEMAEVDNLSASAAAGNFVPTVELFNRHFDACDNSETNMLMSYEHMEQLFSHTTLEHALELLPLIKSKVVKAALLKGVAARMLHNAATEALKELTGNLFRDADEKDEETKEDE